MDARWERSTDGTRAKFARIQGPFAQGQTTFIFLGDLEIVWTHWKGATIPCTGEDCKHCPDKLRRVAYAPAILCYSREGTKVNEQVIFSSPEGCVAQLQAMEPLRGTYAVFSRKAGNQTPRISIPGVPINGELPPTFDVQACLRRIWGLDHKRPEQAKETETEPNIIKFRKFA